MEVKFRDLESGQEITFNPGRDIAHYWPFLVAACVKGLEKENWDASMKELLEPKNIREEDLFLVLVKFTRFCERALDPAITNPKQALDAVGFFNSDPAAIMAFLYRLGIVCSGAWFDAIKRTVPEGTMPKEIQHLVEAGSKLMELINKK